MRTYDASSAECLVFTYREGLLSRAGHDLKLRVRDFTVRFTDEGVEATFDPRSFEVVSAMEGGREKPSALSERDKRQVVDNIERQVLHVARFREIRFAAERPDDDATELRGRLTLHGIERPVTVTLSDDGDHREARLRIHQPDFRIEPFRAMLGALRIRPEVDVVLRIPRA